MLVVHCEFILVFVPVLDNSFTTVNYKVQQIKYGEGRREKEEIIKREK